MADFTTIAIEQIKSEKDLDQFLTLASRFPEFNFSQLCCIYAQMPTATELAPSSYWFDSGTKLRDNQKPVGLFIASINQGKVVKKAVGLYDVSQTDTHQTSMEYSLDSTQDLIGHLRRNKGYTVIQGPIAEFVGDKQTLILQTNNNQGNNYAILKALIYDPIQSYTDDECNILIAQILAKRWHLDIPSFANTFLFLRSVEERKHLFKKILTITNGIILGVEAAI